MLWSVQLSLHLATGDILDWDNLWYPSVSFNGSFLSSSQSLLLNLFMSNSLVLVLGASHWCSLLVDKVLVVIRCFPRSGTNKSVKNTKINRLWAQEASIAQSRYRGRFSRCWIDEDKRFCCEGNFKMADARSTWTTVAPLDGSNYNTWKI